MRILMLVLNTVGQGTYWRALGFGRCLAQRNHQVTLVVTAKQRRWGVVEHVVDGVHIVEMPDLLAGPLRSGWDIWNVMNRIWWMRGRQFDVVHAFEARPTVLLPALYAKYGGNMPLVMDWADWFGRGGSVEERKNPVIRTILRPVETFFEERFRRQADGSTVICTLLQEKAVALGVQPETIERLPNGSDVERFHPVDLAVARQRIGLSPEGIYIGYLGSLFARDAGLLAGAFNRVYEQYPQVRLLMIGNSKIDLRMMVDRPERIVRTGYLDDAEIPNYLAACDLLWLPLCNTNANRGRWPIKLNEYLATGRPIVATAVGDVELLFASAEVGRMTAARCEPFAAETLALLADGALRSRMGAMARHVAETQFAWDDLAERLLAVYARVRAGQRAIARV